MRTIVQIHRSIVTIKVLFYLFKKKDFCPRISSIISQNNIFLFYNIS